MRPNCYSLNLVAALFALAFVLPVQAQDYGTGAMLEVPMATGAITLDGNDDEAAWDSAVEVDLVANWNGGYYDNSIDGGTWGDPDTPDVSVTGKLLWSAGTLYLFVRHSDYQDLFFGADGEPYNGEQILVGIDLTHAGDDQIDEEYGGWPDNAPNLGPTTYKISGAPGVGITTDWGFRGITPVDSGWVAGEVFVDEGNFEWGVEMAINASEIMSGAELGFNIGGATGDEAMLADSTVAGDAVYGYYSWQAANPPGSAGGDVMNNAASFATLSLVGAVASEGGVSVGGFALRPNAPNPFHGATSIAYEMARAGNVELAAYDVLGRQVGVLDLGARSAGEHPATFNATALPAGVYTVRLAVDGAVVASRQVMKVK